MKISIKNRVVSLRFPTGLLSVCFGIFVFVASLVFACSLKAEVFKATAYCSCIKCCDKHPSDKGYGITATGKKARWGTVAVDKRVVKLGSKLRIEGFPNTVFRAEDVGGAVKGKHIDVWFPSHEDAIKFGVRKIVVQRVKNG
jgi:Uncharacterized protein conserved in bacteria